MKDAKHSERLKENNKNKDDYHHPHCRPCGTVLLQVGIAKAECLSIHACGRYSLVWMGEHSWHHRKSHTHARTTHTHTAAASSPTPPASNDDIHAGKIVGAGEWSEAVWTTTVAACADTRHCGAAVGPGPAQGTAGECPGHCCARLATCDGSASPGPSASGR